METHFWRRHSARQTRGAPAAPAPRPHRRPGASGSTVTAVVTASPHSPRHHRLCPWTREAHAGPRGAPGRQALSVPMLLPRQEARGPRPDRLAPTVWPWPQSPRFAAARSPRLRDRVKAGGEVTPGAREAVAVTSAPPNSVCGQPAQPPSLPALLLVVASSQCRNPQRDACATRLCHARTALRRLPQGFSARGPEPGSADRSFRKEREATARRRDRPGTELPGRWPQARVRLGPTAEPSAVCGGNSRCPVLRALT